MVTRKSLGQYLTMRRHQDQGRRKTCNKFRYIVFLAGERVERCSQKKSPSWTLNLHVPRKEGCCIGVGVSGGRTDKQTETTESYYRFAQENEFLLQLRPGSQVKPGFASIRINNTDSLPEYPPSLSHTPTTEKPAGQNNVLFVLLSPDTLK